MNNQDMLKIGAAILVVVVIIVIIFMLMKKDNYEYPSGKLYEPAGTAAWIKNPGDKGQNITQPSTSALVTDVNGNIGVTSPVPIGGIILWAGSSASIPAGWGLCDGSSYPSINGSIQSPDLTSRFVIGAGRSANPSKYVTEYTVGDTGGEEYHQLTPAEMPSHNHSKGFQGVWYSGLDSGFSGGANFQAASPNTGIAGGDTTQTADKDGIYPTLPHNNMPPYYALAYIIKCI